jgi:hypothetical protein
MQLKANLLSSDLPKVAACAAISPNVIPACLSVTQFKAYSVQKGLRATIEKSEKFTLNRKILKRLIGVTLFRVKNSVSFHGH